MWCLSSFPCCNWIKRSVCLLHKAWGKATWNPFLVLWHTYKTNTCSIKNNTALLWYVALPCVWLKKNVLQCTVLRFLRYNVTSRHWGNVGRMKWEMDQVAYKGMLLTPKRTLAWFIASLCAGLCFSYIYRIRQVLSFDKSWWQNTLPLFCPWLLQWKEYIYTQKWIVFPFLCSVMWCCRVWGILFSAFWTCQELLMLRMVWGKY